jgi:hypothetical protein
MKQIIIFLRQLLSNLHKFYENYKKNDWFKLFIIIQLRNSDHIRDFKDLDTEMSKDRMASYLNNKWYYGYDSIFFIFSRLPVFWFIMP